MIRSLLCAALIAILALILAAPDLPLKVHICTFANAEVLNTESRFGGKRPITQGMVDVREAGNKEMLLAGATDGKGKWSFPVSQHLREKKPDLLLVIKAVETHQGQWRIPATDYLEICTAPAAQLAAMPPADSSTLEQTVDRIIEAKLGPLRKELAEAGSRDPGAAEILGGLGFLMGLAGLVMASRRRKG